MSEAVTEKTRYQRAGGYPLAEREVCSFRSATRRPWRRWSALVACAVLVAAVFGGAMTAQATSAGYLAGSPPGADTPTLAATPPDLTIYGVSEGASYNTTVTPTAASTDPSAVFAALLNATPYVLGTDVGAEGSYTLVVVATDPSSNSTTATVHFQIDRTAPDVAIQGVTDGEVTSATLSPTATSTDPSATLAASLDGQAYTLGSAIATEGAHTLVAIATDPAGNSASATVHFTIDKTPPPLTVSDVSEGLTTSGTVTPTATSTDPSATVTATLNGAPHTPGTAITTPDSYTLVVTATDPAGNTTTRTIHFTIDTGAPDVTIHGVAEGVSYNTTVTPTASSTDPSAVFAALLNGVPYTLGTDVGAEGSYTLVATATDPAGNSASATVHFTIDRTAPDITVHGVTGGEVTSATVTPTATSTDPSATITATLDGEPFTLGSTIATEGPHTLVATATDPAGNIVSASVRFTIDRTAPDVTILGVDEGQTYETGPTPTASSSDPSATLTATLNGQPYVLGTQVTADGSYTLVVIATDPAGNTATATRHFAVLHPTPGAPTGLAATAGYASITADWNDNTEPNLGYYELYRSLSASGPFSLIATTAAGTSAYEDTSIDIGTAYHYRVVAVSTRGVASDPSNVDSAVVYPNVRRLWGEDRYETAADAVSKRFPSANTVIIATGENFPDALAAAGLAGSYDAPILLTRRTALPSAVATEIARLGANNAIIVGGTPAVSDAVRAQLQRLSLTVDRIGGIDRYETAVLIGKAIEAREGSRTIAFVARADEFPDALALSPLAYSLKAPIVLTLPKQLPAVSQDYLRTRAFPDVVVAGSWRAVSDAVFEQVDTLAGRTERQGGTTRYETAEMVASYGVSQGWAQWHRVEIAVGTNFPDALTGGPVAGAQGGVLMLTPKTLLHTATEQALTDNRAKIAEVDVLGSTRAIDQTVVDRIATILPH